ncbi:MAG TPA: hypothetical protein VFE37_20715 [Chloroflexota bacterium]|nr:hypothetical protein [Chloroflexota bacterium]
MTNPKVPTRAEMDAVYDRYARPLEADHWGEYVAVSPGGEVLVGPELLDVAQRAREAFGAGNYLFRVGPRTVGRWR